MEPAGQLARGGPKPDPPPIAPTRSTVLPPPSSAQASPADARDAGASPPAAALRPGILRLPGGTSSDHLDEGSTVLQRIGLVVSTLAALRSEVRTKASAEDLRATFIFLAEFFEYVLFLFLLLVVALNMNGLHKAYPLVSNVRELVLGYPRYAYEADGSTVTSSFMLYENVRTRDETWEFVRDQIGGALFAEDGADDSSARFILDGAHLKVGAVRIVTARVRATWDNCPTLPAYRGHTSQPFITTCYPRPTDDAETWDDTPFGTPPGSFEIDPELIDERRVAEDERWAGARLAPRGERGRRLRAGGGGDGAGRRGIADGTGEEVRTPEAKLFKLDVPSDMRRGEWSAYVDRLRARGFIDEQTRVFELLFSVYNVPSNLFCCVTIDVTFPFTGGAFGAATFYTIEPVRHLAFLTRRGFELFGAPSTLDGAKLTAEIVFLLLVLRTLGWEARKAAMAVARVRRDASRMDSDGTTGSRLSALLLGAANALQKVQFWSLLQVISLGLHLVVIGRRFSVLHELLGLELNPRSGQYVDLHYVADQLYLTQNIVAINVLLSFLSLFKFATVVPQLSMLNRTIAVAFNDLVSFLLMFMIVFTGFMQAFQLSFGQDLHEFAGSAASFYTLFGVLSGDVNLNELRAANKLLGPLLFLGYAIFIIFVLLNMFVAIVTSAYAKAKKELKEDPTMGKLYKTIRYTSSLFVSVATKQYKFLILAIRSRKTQREISLAIRDGIVTLAELREILKSSKLGEKSDKFLTWRYWSAADLVMRRYDPDGNGWLTKDELERLRADMAAESEQRKLILELHFHERDEATRIEKECTRRMLVHAHLTAKVDTLVGKHTELLHELAKSRATIHAALGTLTGKLWGIWERCDLI
ncbi:hypothetical protein KFE25_004020 [Diacronema lutheri]|uniref:EF-hand domain-containing protein n=2 Tax=Diacronema lutheri TaxID=2081491 RepID=A0A8J6C6P3_DIALT|nr:hypothetical protein KFE25_004020 [Diacronema lutheri]